MVEVTTEAKTTDGSSIINKGMTSYALINTFVNNSTIQHIEDDLKIKKNCRDQKEVPSAAYMQRIKS